jgi:hypothetical protein
MSRRTALLLAVLGCSAALGVSGCGSGSTTRPSPTVSTAMATTENHVAKTKFVAHAALAYGAFHHFIFDPAQAGDFNHPLLHKLAIANAGLATVFVYRELRLAATDVKGSNVLATLFAPLAIAAGKVKRLDGQIKTGNASQVGDVNSGLTSIESTAASNGQGFGDKVPSSGELASGGV